MDLSYCFTSYRLARHKTGKQPTLADTYGVAIISIAIISYVQYEYVVPHTLYTVLFLTVSWLLALTSPFIGIKTDGRVSLWRCPSIPHFYFSVRVVGLWFLFSLFRDFLEWDANSQTSSFNQNRTQRLAFENQTHLAHWSRSLNWTRLLLSLLRKKEKLKIWKA